MIHMERQRTIDATPEAVWAVLGNFMHVDEFAPAIASVDALTTGEIGLGSRRRNHFQNGTSLVEEVTAWHPGEGFSVKLSDMGALPLLEANSTMRVSQSNGKSIVTWAINYRVKYGPVGWLMGQTFMKFAFGKVVDGNLKGLSDRVHSAQGA